ncbi:response regulator [Candidatus Woesearchaeota archaeon]|nr:response regulator [Candidatus Woesearchaeota archaeon]
MTKILIVDDMQDIRYTVKAGLEGLNKGYEVIEAKDGEEAMKTISQSKPDLILMDVMMPGEDGLDVTLKLKNDPSFKNIPVIILTAKTDNLTRGTSEVAADAFVEKPFDINTLDDLIQATLMQKEASDGDT